MDIMIKAKYLDGYMRGYLNKEAATAIEPTMTPAEMLRHAVISEYEAVTQYEAIAKDLKDKDPGVAGVMRDIAKEERVHIGELMQLMQQLDPAFKPSILKGKEEVKGEAD